jgi:hypothetical protein
VLTISTVLKGVGTITVNMTHPQIHSTTHLSLAIQSDTMDLAVAMAVNLTTSSSHKTKPATKALAKPTQRDYNFTGILIITLAYKNAN